MRLFTLKIHYLRTFSGVWRSKCPKFRKMRGKSAQLCPFNELSCPSWTFQAEFCKWSHNIQVSNPYFHFIITKEIIKESLRDLKQHVLCAKINWASFLRCYWSPHEKFSNIQIIPWGKMYIVKPLFSVSSVW